MGNFAGLPYEVARALRVLRNATVSMQRWLFRSGNSAISLKTRHVVSSFALGSTNCLLKTLRVHYPLRNKSTELGSEAMRVWAKDFHP